MRFFTFLLHENDLRKKFEMDFIVLISVLAIWICFDFLKLLCKVWRDYSKHRNVNVCF